MTEITIEKLTELTKLPIPVLFCLGLNAIGVAIKFLIPKVSGKIPALLILFGAALYPLMFDYSSVVLNVFFPYLIAGIHGAIIGLASVGVYELFIKRMVERYEKKTTAS